MKIRPFLIPNGPKYNHISYNLFHPEKAHMLAKVYWSHYFGQDICSGIVQREKAFRIRKSIVLL